MTCRAPAVWLACVALVLSSELANAQTQQADEWWKPAIPSGPVALGLRPFEYITPDGRRDSADAGAFRVPVRYDMPSPPDSLTLVFVRLRSRAPSGAPPLVYLSGGPGTSAIDIAGQQQMRFFEDMRAAGDVILLDQRGTGRSEPLARCEGRWDMSADRPLNDAKLLRDIAAQGRRCAAALRARGVDLHALVTRNIADDVEGLRRTLGVARINLFGFSSGSHFALEVLRRHPHSVHRIVLGGVEGPGQTYKLPANAAPMLGRLDSVIRAHPPFGGRVPNFLALVDSVHRQLHAKPVVARIPIRTVLQAERRSWWRRWGINVLALVKPTYDVTIHDVDLQALLAVGLGRMDVLSELPALYRGIADGRYERAGLLMLALRKAQDVGSAMGWMVDCADGVSRARADSINGQAGSTMLGAMANFPFPHVCEGFQPIPDAGDAERRPVRSDVPVLLAVGALDGRTSLEQANEVMQTLPNATLITVDNAAHGDVAIFNAPEIRAAVVRFLRGQSVRLTRLTLAPPVFVATTAPSASLVDTLVAAGKSGGADAVRHTYEVLRGAHANGTRFDFGEPALNQVGYQLLQAGAIEAALAAFRLNVGLFPRSLNVYDSFGEGLLAAKRWPDAAACLGVAVSLGYNPHSYRLVWTIPAGVSGADATEALCVRPPWRL